MGAFTTKDFEQNFKLLYRPLCLFALRYTENIDEAEDVVQQAFIDIWDKKHTLETIGNFKAYMYRAVRNRSRQSIEQPANQLPDCEDESEEEQINISERDARLWKAIDTLPPERKKNFPYVETGWPQIPGNSG